MFEYGRPWSWRASFGDVLASGEDDPDWGEGKGDGLDDEYYRTCSHVVPRARTTDENLEENYGMRTLALGVECRTVSSPRKSKSIHSEH